MIDHPPVSPFCQRQAYPQGGRRNLLQDIVIKKL